MTSHADVDEVVTRGGGIGTVLVRLFTVIIGATVFTASSTAVGQGYPNKPIRLIVPLAAGTTLDIVARYFGNELGKRLGHPLVIENKPGAGGSIGMAELARATPDGYTIGFASQGTLIFNQAIYASPGYDSVKDFQPIALVGAVSNVMIVPPTSTFATPTDVIVAATAKPGELTFSSGGPGTSTHLSGALFAQVTDTKLVHVPYKGASQGVLAVMTGEVNMGFFNTPVVISQIKGGKLKALGVTSLKRSPLLPDVPTLDELGVKGFEVSTWLGFIAPLGTPPQIVALLNGEINKIVSSNEAIGAMGPQGFELSPPLTPTALGKLIADDLNKWVPIVKASGAKAD